MKPRCRALRSSWLNTLMDWPLQPTAAAAAATSAIAAEAACGPYLAKASLPWLAQVSSSYFTSWFAVATLINYISVRTETQSNPSTWRTTALNHESRTL
jgi:hypothetical protein